MLNQIVLVGVVNELPILEKSNDGLHYTRLQLDVTRAFRNSEGGYDSDIIECVLWRSVAESSVDLCGVGSIVGIKGRLQSSVFKDIEGNIIVKYEVVAEKVSVLGKK